MTGEPARDWTAEAVVAHLATLGSEENRAGMVRFGISTERAFGIGTDPLRRLARKIGRDHERALRLFESGWREARLLACFTADPLRLTPDLCLSWAAEFNSWDVVDTAADLFGDAPFWRELIDRFAADEREFVRRTAFSMLAWTAVHRKSEPDKTFAEALGLIELYSTDNRNFVRKAVNWALRQIGKRSLDLHGPALALGARLAGSADRSQRWSGKDAVRELSAPKTLERLRAKAARTQPAERPPSLSSTR